MVWTAIQCCIPKTWIPIFKSDLYRRKYNKNKRTINVWGFLFFLKSWKLGNLITQKNVIHSNCLNYLFLAIFLVLVFLQAASKIQNKHVNWSVTFSNVNTIRFMVYGQIQRECLPGKLTTLRKPLAQRVSTIKMTKILYVIVSKQVSSLFCFAKEES